MGALSAITRKDERRVRADRRCDPAQREQRQPYSQLNDVDEVRPRLGRKFGRRAGARDRGDLHGIPDLRLEAGTAQPHALDETGARARWIGEAQVGPSPAIASRRGPSVFDPRLLVRIHGQTPGAMQPIRGHPGQASAEIQSDRA